MILDQHTGEKLTATQYAKELIHGTINSGLIAQWIEGEFNCDTDLTDAERVRIREIAEALERRILKIVKPASYGKYLTK